MENEFAHIANTVKIAANFYDICRLCLNQGRLEPLTNISFPLLSFLQVQLNHTLPKNVCEHCLQEMFNFTSFIEKCKHSQNILKQLEIGCEKIKILILVDKKNHEIKNVKSELEPEPIIVNDSEDESETSRNEPSKPDSKKLIDHYKANENSSPTNKKNDEIETVDSKVKLEQFVNDSKDEFETIRNEPSKPASKKLKTCAKCGETVTKMIDHYKANKNCRPTKKISDENVNSKPEPEPGRIVNDSIDESETRRNEPSKPDSKKIKICPKCGDTITKMMDHYKTSRACRPRNFKCAECNISFKSTYYLKSHHLALHEKFLKYMCHICSKMFKFETNLKRHLTVHKLGKMFMCEYCGKGYTTKVQLDDHINSHTGNKPYTCSFCGKRFESRSSLLEHERNHQNQTRRKKSSIKKNVEDDVKCDKCERSFESQRSLHMHCCLVHYYPRKTSTCVQCDKTFTSPAYLEIHMRSHTGERPYSCTVCSKTFIQKSHLMYHNLLHEGIKSFQCNVCAKQFTLKGNLTVHMRLHTGERPYPCHMCEKRFCDSSRRKRHIIAAHGENQLKFINKEVDIDS